MPAFRDLKGRPVDEVVTSREVPGLATAFADRSAVQEAVQKVTATKHRDDPPIVSDLDLDAPALPEDFEACLQQLETALRAVDHAVEHARQVMAVVRARAQKDAGLLTKLADLVKQMGE